MQHAFDGDLALRDGRRRLDGALCRRLQGTGKVDRAAERRRSAHPLHGGERAGRLFKANGVAPERAGSARAERVRGEQHLLAAEHAARHRDGDLREDAAAPLLLVAGGGEFHRGDLRSGAARHARGSLVAGDLRAEGNEPLVGDDLALPCALCKHAQTHLARDVQRARARHDARQPDLLAVREHVADVIGVEFLFKLRLPRAGIQAAQPRGAEVADDALPARKIVQLRRDEQPDLCGDDRREDERAAVLPRLRLFDGEPHLRAAGGGSVRAFGAVRELRAPLRADHGAVLRACDDRKVQLAAVTHFAVAHLRARECDARADGERAVLRPVAQPALHNGLRTDLRAARGIVVCGICGSNSHGIHLRV